MKTSFFTVMGLLALACLGATNPIAQERSSFQPEPDPNVGGFKPDPPRVKQNPPQLKQESPPPGLGRGRGGPERGRLPETKQFIFYCKAGDKGDIGRICEQCQGTPVPDILCAPAKQGCKVKDDTCFTDQKCQQEYGEEAKAQQCGKQDSLQSNQLASNNRELRPERLPRPEGGSKNTEGQV